MSLLPQTTAFFDQDFNRSAIETRLNDDYTVIHLATHAEFRSGHPTDSFILLGDGDRLTVADLNRWQLPDVDLVILSACKTAVSSELGDGAEILGFGYQMQQTGADAAIASLWYVSDGGTQVLMDAFYTALENGLSESGRCWIELGYRPTNWNWNITPAQIVNQQLDGVAKHLYRFGIAQCLSMESCQIVTQAGVFTFNSGHVRLGDNPVFVWQKLVVDFPPVADPEVAIPMSNSLP